MEFVKKNMHNKERITCTLVEEIKSGEIKPLIAWLEFNKTKLYRIGWNYLYNNYDIEDVLHNTLVKVYTNIKKLKNEKFFDTWCISIFINECKLTLKNSKRTLPLDYCDTKITQEPDVHNLDLAKALNSLDPSLKDLVILQYIMGYTQIECAQILSLPLGTVKSRGHRAIKLLREQLIEKEGY